jgi:hypothetical protein
MGSVELKMAIRKGQKVCRRVNFDILVLMLFYIQNLKKEDYRRK